MANQEYKNSSEEIGAWGQILYILGNSKLFYLPFETIDSRLCIEMGNF